MIRPLMISPPVLSFVYATAVHIFLASFHERQLKPLRYWRPIFIRLVYSIVVGLTTIFLTDDGYYSSNQINKDGKSGSCYWNEMRRSFRVSLWAAAAVNIVLSGYLIADTRRKEVDGPSPPFHIASDKSDESQKALNMQNKVVLITGANAGIGLETAKQLYNRGAVVVFGCRSRERALEAMKSIDPVSNINESSSGSSKSQQKRMHFLPLDLTSKSSVKKAVELFDEMKLPLHILINNAGVMRQNREETRDGIEMTMAANHFGHFLLTNLLLPKLRQTAIKEEYPSKVITLSSSLYTRAFRPSSQQSGYQSVEPGIDLNDLQCKHKRYTLFDQYSQSKLANILFARELGRRENIRAITRQQLNQATFCPIQSYAVHPGLVRTNVVRDMPWYLYYPNIIFAIFMAVLQKTPRSGAYTSVYCAVVNDFTAEDHKSNEEVSYYVNSEAVHQSAASKSQEDAAILWKISCDLLKLPFEEVGSTKPS